MIFGVESVSVESESAVHGHDAESFHEMEDNPDTEHDSEMPEIDNSDELCPICLECIDDKTLLNQCLHPFCHECILRWSLVSRNCPLCKETYTECFHEFMSDKSFKRVCVPSLLRYMILILI